MCFEIVDDDDEEELHYVALVDPESPTTKWCSLFFLVACCAIVIVISLSFIPIWVSHSDECPLQNSTAQLDSKWRIQSSSNKIYNGSQPNIILILTDDQGIELQHSTPLIQHWFSSFGTNFTNTFAANPVCCPSRASLLSGRYFHNVREDNWTDSFSCNIINSKCGCQRANVSNPTFESSVYANHLQQAGYRTVYAGKYLNKPYMTQFCDESVGLIPPGWDVWHATCRQGFNSMTFLNGTHPESSFQNATYTTSVIGNLSVSLIDDHFKNHNSQPLHLVVSFRAPHSPWNPSPWYKHRKDEVSGVINRTLNPRCHATDHFPLQHDLPPLQPNERFFKSRVYRKRQLTMWSVDEAVDALFLKLQELQVLNDTLVVFTSDHGYHYDMFNLGIGKTQAYQADARVPFLVRWPNVISQSHVSKSLVSLVDIAPTFLDVAGLSTTEMDGHSLVPLLTENNVVWRQAVLVEHASLSDDLPWFSFFAKIYGSFWNMLYTRFANRPDDHNVNSYRALYTDNNLLYIERTHLSDWNFDHIQGYELYNLTSDPMQLSNVYSTSSTDTQTILSVQMLDYWHCKGTQCP